MKRWIGTALNWFLPGLGYIIFGEKRLLGIPWAVAMAGLTYVELSIQEPMPDLYMVMFGSVLLFNTAFAVDSYQTFKAAEDAAG